MASATGSASTRRRTATPAAHAAAGAMLDAYGTAADAFIHWADTGGGLAGLAALGDALDAAQTASTALDAFGRTLETTTCPA